MGVLEGWLLVTKRKPKEETSGPWQLGGKWTISGHVCLPHRCSSLLVSRLQSIKCANLYVPIFMTNFNFVTVLD